MFTSVRIFMGMFGIMLSNACAGFDVDNGYKCSVIWSISVSTAQFSVFEDAIAPSAPMFYVVWPVSVASDLYVLLNETEK